MFILLEDDDWILETGTGQFVDQCPVFGQTVLVDALGNQHHFRMEFQAGTHFIGECTIGDKQKFPSGRAAAYKRQHIRCECRPGACFASPDICVDNIVGRFAPFFSRQISAAIDVVRLQIRISFCLLLCYFRLLAHPVGNNYRNLFATDIAYRLGLSAAGSNIVEVFGRKSRYGSMSGTAQYVIN